MCVSVRFGAFQCIAVCQLSIGHVKLHTPTNLSYLAHIVCKLLLHKFWQVRASFYSLCASCCNFCASFCIFPTFLASCCKLYTFLASCCNLYTFRATCCNLQVVATCTHSLHFAKQVDMINSRIHQVKMHTFHAIWYVFRQMWHLY